MIEEWTDHLDEDGVNVNVEIGVCPDERRKELDRGWTGKFIFTSVTLSFREALHFGKATGALSESFYLLLPALWLSESSSLFPLSSVLLL